MRKLLIILLPWIIASCHQNDEPDPPIENNRLRFFTQSLIIDQIGSTIDQIERNGKVDGSSTGYEGIKSDQYKRYEALTKFSEDSLIKLTNHRSPAVRVYAFDALAERNSGHVFQIFEIHIADKARFIERSGCMGSEMTVNISYLRCIIKFLRKEKDLEYTQRVSAFYSEEEWKYFSSFCLLPPKQLNKKINAKSINNN